MTDQATECPSCGVIIEKWRKLQERRKQSVAAGPVELEPTPARIVDPWTARLAAAVVVALWMGLFAWFMSRQPRGRHRAARIPSPGQTVYLRDAATGELKPLKVESPAPAAGAERSASAANKNPAEMREASWVEEAPAAKP